jgi:predicted ATPase
VAAILDLGHAAGMTSAATQTSVVAGLPHRLSSFVGRDVERAEVAARLEGTRLLTLTGVGGCGKTSLALEVAREVGMGFPDGIFWVELAPLSGLGLVAPCSGAAWAFGRCPMRQNWMPLRRFLRSGRSS